MTTLQTVAALEEFRARYGAPYWSAENEDQVLQDWDNVLKRYSVLDVRTACGELCAFGKLKTFPTIGHLAAYLKKGYQPEDNSRPEETKKNTFMDELEQYRSRCIRDGVDGRLCLSSDVDEAMRRTMADIDAEYPAEHHWETRTASEAIGLGLRNKVFWEKLEMFLRSVTAKNAAYVPTGDNTFDRRSIPTKFSFDETMRKTA